MYILFVTDFRARLSFLMLTQNWQLNTSAEHPTQTVPKVTKHVFVKFLIPERLLNSKYPLRYSIFPKILLITAADQMPQVTRFRLKIIKNRIEMIETKGEK